MTVPKVFRLIAGIVLLLIGVAGGFIPIFQGWMFVLPGLVLLSDFFPPIRRLLENLKARRSGALKD